MMRSRQFSRFAVLTGTLLLGACALSPQQVVIKPDLAPAEQSFAGGKQVSVTIDDAREQKVLGSRGGVYEDTSTISVSNDIRTALAAPVRQKLESQGFEIRDTAQAARYRVIVDTLRYQRADDVRLGHEIEVTAVIRSEVSRGGESYHGRYQVKNTRRFASAPSNEQNEKLINTTLSEALERMFDDQQLRRFLVQ